MLGLFKAPPNHCFFSFPSSFLSFSAIVWPNWNWPEGKAVFGCYCIIIIVRVSRTLFFLSFSSCFLIPLSFLFSYLSCLLLSFCCCCFLSNVFILVSLFLQLSELWVFISHLPPSHVFPQVGERAVSVFLPSLHQFSPWARVYLGRSRCKLMKVLITLITMNWYKVRWP